MSKARELANLRGTPTDNNVLLHSLAGDAITAGSGTYNVAVGANAFGAGTTGDDNIAIGQTALAAATIDNVSKVFKPNVLIITSGDRNDIIIGACMAYLSGVNIAGLLLTGGHIPSKEKTHNPII